MSVLMTICIRKKTVSLSWVMKCQQKSDVFHISALPSRRWLWNPCCCSPEKERKGWKEEGRRREERLTGNHRSATEEVDSDQGLYTELAACYAPFVHIIKSSLCCSAASWFVHFLLSHLVQETLRAYHEVYHSPTFSLRRQLEELCCCKWVQGEVCKEEERAHSEKMSRRIVSVICKAYNI